MPFVLIVSGTVLIVAAVRNTQQQLFFLLASDFTGPNNFIYWFLSILVIGAIGYIPKMKPLSDGFLILVILVLFLKKGTGFVDMFQRQISATDSASPQVKGNQTTNAGFVSSGGGGGGIQIGIGGGGSGINIGLGGIGIGLGGIPGWDGTSPCSPNDLFCEFDRRFMAS